jgi:nucleoside-diphosphate-sugar epimerase
MRVLVAGAAGLIGYHVAEHLLGRGEEVVGVDNLDSYYDVSLKEARPARLTQQPGFGFAKLDIADRARPKGREKQPAEAARGRARDSRRHNRPRQMVRLQAEDTDPSGRPPFCRVVQGVPLGVIQQARS